MTTRSNALTPSPASSQANSTPTSSLTNALDPRAELDKLYTKVDTLADAVKISTETLEKHQTELIDSRKVIEATQSISYLGFLILLVMMGSIVIDVLTHVLEKPEPTVIYQMDSR